MAKTLQHLIQASGNAGSSGQNFLSHVTGAASGVGCDMVSYNLFSWEFAGEVPAPELTYTHPQDFDMTIDFTQNSRASNIKRTGTVITLEEISWPAGANAYISAQDVVGAATGSTISVHVDAPYSPVGSAIQHDGWFVGYVEPATPPGSDPEPVEMFHSLTGTGGSGSQEVSFYLRYLPDTPGYNPMLLTQFDADMYNRGEVIADWEFEWFSDSGYSVLEGSAWNHIVDSSPGGTVHRWSRARRIGEGSWNNLGEITFDDPREPE